MSDSNIIRSKLPKDTTFDRIFTHYQEGLELTDKEEEQRVRWETAFSLLMNFHSTEQAINILKTKYQYGRATAYRDISNAIRLFGDVGKASKEGRRHILYEYSMKVFQLAASMKPPNLAEMNKAIKNMMEISGLDVNDPDMPNFEDLQPHEFNLILPPELLNTLQQLVLSGAINLSELREKAKTIDVSHTDLKDDSTQQ